MAGGPKCYWRNCSGRTRLRVRVRVRVRIASASADCECECGLRVRLRARVRMRIGDARTTRPGGMMEPVEGRREAGGALPRYNHRRLDAYQVALEFIRWRQANIRHLPRGSNLGDQLDRAASSIALNIAEGSGESSPAERARFFRFARRSATECDAALDVI